VCRSVRHRDTSSDTSADTVPVLEAVFSVNAHVFVIDRAPLLMGGNRDLRGRTAVS
jgi:hypothetical protein